MNPLDKLSLLLFVLLLAYIFIGTVRAVRQDRRRPRHMAVRVRRRRVLPTKPQVLCDADVSGWQPQRSRALSGVEGSAVSGADQ